MKRTLLFLKQELARVQDITQDPDFEFKPKAVRYDLLKREEQLRNEISIAIIDMQRNKK